jgi:hypothetical protein
MSSTEGRGGSWCRWLLNPVEWRGGWVGEWKMRCVCTIHESCMLNRSTEVKLTSALLTGTASQPASGTVGQ